MRSDRLIHEIRAKRPALAAAADRGSRKAAIHMFCLECCGGSGHVAVACEVRNCSLWPFSLAASKAKRAPHASSE